MKRIYNKFIEWTFSVLAILLYIPLIIVKVTMKIVVKIIQAIIFIVDEGRIRGGNGCCGR